LFFSFSFFVQVLITGEARANSASIEKALKQVEADNKILNAQGGDAQKLRCV
jgi:hypothetical protein